MLVVIDTTMLTLLLRPNVIPPNDPNTGQPVARASERVELLVTSLIKARSRVLIPATVWAEFLVMADSEAQEYAALIKDLATVEIVPFDQISAAEAAIDQKRALKAGGNALTGSRQCLKADRQIMGVAKTRNVDMVYASDRDFITIGASMNIPVTMLWDLPLPPSTMPLFDDTVEDGATGPDVSSASEQPSLQSPSDELAIETPSEPDLPSGPPGDPASPQPDSSPTVPPQPPSDE